MMMALINESGKIVETGDFRIDGNDIVMNENARLRNARGRLRVISLPPGKKIGDIISMSQATEAPVLPSKEDFENLQLSKKIQILYEVLSWGRL